VSEINIIHLTNKLSITAARLHLKTSKQNSTYDCSAKQKTKMKNTKSIVLALMLIAGIFACKKSEDTNPASDGTVTVTIGQATSIGETFITVTVVVSGNATIVQRGVCWDSIQTTPTISNNKKVDPGTTAGSFTVSIDQLSPATTYYVRGYVTTSSQTIYSPVRVYTTGSAQLTIDGINNITDTSATINASLIYSGALQVGARGFCWGTQASPTIFSVNHDTIGSGIGNFITTIKGLQSNTKYHVRAYAIIGTGNLIYSADSTFNTNEYAVYDNDGNGYHVVKMGAKWWMKENLRTATYNNGTTILTGLNDADWTSNTSGACADYDNVPANSSVFGKLYNAYAVANPAGLCPTGWHVSTNSDWNKVAKIVDAAADTNITSGAQSLTGGSAIKDFPGSTNSTGLSIVPGGTKYPIYGDYSFSGYYWTESAIIRSFYSPDDGIYSYDSWDPMWGLSVRCVKN